MPDRDATQPVSPYEGIEERAFWRAGVADAGAYPPPDIYRPRFRIPRDLPVLTAGSCFAQHVGRTLAEDGFNVIDAEPLPRSIPAGLARSYGYGLYSARYGNIYTMRQFLQLIGEAQGDFMPAEPVLERDGRYYDALRPGVEPGGLDTPDMVKRARSYHLAAVKRAMGEAGLVVFTMGLTEAWQHSESGTVYPTAPGTIAGRMDEAVYSFVNFRAAAIRADFEAARDILRRINPEMRFVLTVSPVPLTATASGDHVLPATVYSKSVLRAVAGELCEDFPDVDYFPSYEIVTSHAVKGAFFEPNLRSVSARGVRRVMRSFLAAHSDRADRKRRRQARRAAQDAAAAGGGADVICEEELLEAFGE